MAALLRALADQVEHGLAEVDGHTVRLGDSLHAVVEVPEDPAEEATLVGIRLAHPTHRGVDLTRLQAALSHPGD